MNNTDMDELPEGAVAFGNKGPTYSVSELAQVTRLSRATIRYYERIGLLRPEDLEEPGHRYTQKGLRRLANAVTLRNLGYSPSEIAGRADEDLMSPDHLSEYQARLDRTIAYAQAQKECLAHKADLAKKPAGSVWIGEVEAYLVKDGLPITDIAQGLPTRKEAPMYMPIASMGMRFVGPAEHPLGYRNGRFVLQRHAHLVEGYPDTLDVLGGRTCVCGVFRTRIDQSQTWGEWGRMFSALLDLAREQDLAVAGAAFVPYTLYADDTMHALICLPVTEAGEGLRPERETAERNARSGGPWRILQGTLKRMRQSGTA